MDLITSHNALDFDGLASMVAAQQIYPSAIKVFSGTLSKNVKKFMALYKDLLMIKQPSEVALNRVSQMIVVDTANANRLGGLKEVAHRKGMKFHIYDHHPSSPDDLRADEGEISLVGAATTLLVERIKEQNLSISSFNATILALGIYEDTGSLLFTSTTSRDLAAAAFLLESGANLSVVANFIEQPFSSEQRQLLQSLLNTARRHKVKNVDIVIAESNTKEFIPGLDMVTYRLLEVENSDVAFAVAMMQNKVNVVGRSRTNNVKINEILKIFGGRGHPKAASVVVKGKGTEEVVKIILEQLKENVSPALLACSIMSTPVKTIPIDFSMEEAGKVMLRYGHTGMPVIQGDRMVGVLSRRDVDKARIHNLGHAPVKGFMTSKVLSVSPRTPVAEIQREMVDHDIGRLPVMDNGKLVGIVSRTDILRTLHGGDYPEDHEVLFAFTGDEAENCFELMQERLPSRLNAILRLAGEVADGMGSNVYCVGGFVRDLFLKEPNFDVDLVVEGDGETFACELAEHLGGKCKVHKRFKTAVVALPDGTKIDVATARTEYYEFPAALPRVERASIKEDMYRRDFTINTLALCLNPDKFGDLIDYFGGRRDITKGNIRILYNMSFVEDPTRILRAIRFEQRYGFTIEPDTLRFAKDAIERRIVRKLSYGRIMNELVLILNEKDPLRALNRMREIGVWEYILPQVDPSQLDSATLKRVPVVVAWWEERYHKTNVRLWLVYILLFLSRLNQEKIAAAMEQLPMDKYSQKAIAESFMVPSIAERLIRERLEPGEIDKLVRNWNRESIIYLLLCLKDEPAWENFVQYLDLKEEIKIDINGNDVKKLGLKAGPVFSLIFDELYRLKLNGQIHNRKDELHMVQQWIQEGKF
ncbi:MAG: CBS domain-containing protein [Syntrophomonadaceae bacterium]|nr:CBS domain-containing protein [Syntrophomonadaceae bacterium]